MADIRKAIKRESDRRTKGAAMEAAALAELRTLARQAIADGMTKMEFHKLSGVTRQTLDGWLESKP